MRAKGSLYRRAARIGAAVALLSTTACPGFGDRVPTGRVTWKSDVARIIASACGECHGEQPSQGAPFPLVTYAQTKPFAERIQVRAYQLRTMPPSGDMADDDREKLYLWWQAGAPEDDETTAPVPDAQDVADAQGVQDSGADAQDLPDSGADAEAPGLDAAPPVGGAPAPSVPTWDVEIEPIITRRCAVCHGTPLVAGAPYALETYEQVLEHKARVVARAVEGDSMPPGQPLDEIDQALLARWVEGGAPR